MTAIKDMLSLNAVREITESVTDMPIEACSCKGGQGGFATLPGTTLAVHECGKPKPAALKMFPEQYAQALHSHREDIPTLIAAVSANDRAKVAASEQRQIETIKRNAKKETVVHVVDLSNIPDAELGRIFRRHLLERKIESLPLLRAEAVAEVKAAEIEADEVRTEAQERRQSAAPMPQIVVNEKVVIPALDLADVGLDEAVPNGVRSPYNKARFALGEKEALNPRVTTYRRLAVEHARIAGLVAQRDWNGDDCCDDHPPVQQADPVMVAASLDDLTAKVTAFMKVTGITDEEVARQLVRASL